MLIDFSEQELKVISELCLEKDLSPSKIIKQALAQYQLVSSGIFQLKEVVPLQKFPTVYPVYDDVGSFLGYSNER